MFKRAVFLSSAIVLGSFSYANASVSSVVEACGGSACAAAISAEISGMTPAQVRTFLAALTAAAIAPNAAPGLKASVAAGLATASQSAPTSVAGLMADAGQGIASAQVETAAVNTNQPAQNQGSGN